MTAWNEPQASESRAGVDDARAAGPLSAEAGAAAPRRTRGEQIRVLVVDDSPTDAAMIQRMLAKYERATIRTSHTTSSTECLDRLRKDDFDIVLLDYHMPGDDGLTCLRRLSGLAGAPPAIMLTGEGDERLAVEALRCGAYDYYPKSAITPEVLGRAVYQALETFRLDEELRSSAEPVVFVLAAAVEGKDPTTRGHLRRMSRYATLLGQALGLDKHQLLMLRYGAILHDIGKVAVRDSILVKPGALTESEREELRRHPTQGERICAPLSFSQEVGPIIRHHHECWDGSGYVDGLKGEAIPFLARVASVVDAFDAMHSDRPYRSGLSRHETMVRLEEGAGSQWDPDITRVFLDLVKGGGLDHDGYRAANAA